MAFGKLRSFFKVGISTGERSYSFGSDPGFGELQAVLRAHGIDPEKGGSVELTGEKAEALKRDIEAVLESTPGAGATPPAAAAPPADPVDRLMQLAKLRREGALSESEFNEAKRKVLEDL